MPKADRQFDAAVLYVPVIHRGYLQFLESYKSAKAVYILGPEILSEVDYLRKELRAITPAQAAGFVNSLGIFKEVKVVGKKDLADLDVASKRFILPDEDVSRYVVGEHLSKAKTEFGPVFLRWNRDNVDAEAGGKVKTIEPTKSVKKVFDEIYKEAAKSPDTYRRVGAAIVRKNKITAKASNQPLTTQNTPWAEGDPRSVYRRGVGIEMSTFMHAEARLVADAARRGESLEDAELYVTTFPCPPCAMLVATSGIRKLYYVEGYAVLDGLRVMEEAGVDVAHVKPIKPRIDTKTLVHYPAKKD